MTLRGRTGRNYYCKDVQTGSGDAKKQSFALLLGRSTSWAAAVSSTRCTVPASPIPLITHIYPVAEMSEHFSLYLFTTRSSWGFRVVPYVWVLGRALADMDLGCRGRAWIHGWDGQRGGQGRLLRRVEGVQSLPDDETAERWHTASRTTGTSRYPKPRSLPYSPLGGTGNHQQPEALTGVEDAFRRFDGVKARQGCGVTE